MKTGRKGGSTVRDDVHHPVHSASRGLTRRLRVESLGYKDSVGDKNRKWLSRWEFLVYFVLVPAILIVIQYLVPYSIKNEYFILHLNNPTPWAMFLTNYVHTDDPLHLWGNIFVYILIILYIFKFSTNKREIYIVSAIFFFILPFIISYSSIVALQNIPINSLGFSGIITAFIGYFPYVFYRYVKRTYSQKFNFSFPLSIVMISLLIAIIFDYPSLMLYAVILFLSLLPFIYAYRRELSMVFNAFHQKLEELEKSNMLYRLAVYGFYAVAFFLLFVSLKELIEPPTVNDFSNIIAHFVSYLFGFFVPLVTFEPFYYFKGGVRDV